VKIAQEQLGHASITTTLNIYTRVVDASHRRAIEAVERGSPLTKQPLRNDACKFPPRTERSELRRASGAQ
jgi:hypothetical protein